MKSIIGYYKDRYSKHLVEMNGQKGELHVFDGVVKAATIKFNWAVTKRWEDVKKDLNTS